MNPSKKTGKIYIGLYCKQKPQTTGEKKIPYLSKIKYSENWFKKHKLALGRVHMLHRAFCADNKNHFQFYLDLISDAKYTCIY